MNEAEAQKVLELQEDDLLLALGRVVDTDQHSKPQPPDTYIAAAHRWLSENWSFIKEKVCGSERIQEILNNQKVVDDTGLVIAIFSIFSGYLEPAVSMLVSGLVVRRGLHSVCCIS